VVAPGAESVAYDCLVVSCGLSLAPMLRLSSVSLAADEIAVVTQSDVHVHVVSAAFDGHAQGMTWAARKSQNHDHREHRDFGRVP